MIIQVIHSTVKKQEEKNDHCQTLIITSDIFLSSNTIHVFFLIIYFYDNKETLAGPDKFT